MPPKPSRFARPLPSFAWAPPSYSAEGGMALGCITTRAIITRCWPNEYVDGNGQGGGDFTDEVTGWSQAADGKVRAEFDAAGTTGLGGEGLIQRSTAGFDERGCLVGAGRNSSGIGRPRSGQRSFKVRIIGFRVALGETGNETETHNCGRTRLRSSARDVL